MTKPHASCATCPRSACTYVPPTIVEGAPLAIVGRDPGDTEAREGQPFVGQAGRLLNLILSKAGIDRAGVSILNTVACHRPGNPPPTGEEIAACAPVLDEALDRAKPGVVVACGAVAAQRFVGPIAITLERGGVLTPPPQAQIAVVEQDSLTLIKSGPRKGAAHKIKVPVVHPITPRTIIPTIHPAELLRTGYEDLPLLLADFRRAHTLASGQPLAVVGGGTIKGDLDLEGVTEMVLDVETDSEGRLTMIGLTTDGQSSTNLLPTSPHLSALWKWLANPDHTVVGHNFGFDYKVLSQYSPLPIAARVWDTMHAAHFARNDLPKGLDKVSSRLASHLYSNWKYAHRTGNLDTTTYNHLDVCWTYALREDLTRTLKVTNRLSHYEQVIAPLVRTVAQLEQRGVPVDLDAWAALRARQSAILADLEARWATETGGINHRSNPALQDYFYGALKLRERVSRKTGRPTLDRTALLALQDKYPKVAALSILNQIRHAEKVLSTYLSFDAPYGRLFPQYNLSGTDTGRLSGGGEDGFNFQNIPRSSDGCSRGVEGCACYDLRSLFIAPPGKQIAVADWSQIEFRLSAWLAGEQELIDLYAIGDFDIHSHVAAMLGISRTVAKTIVHGGNYGMGAAKVAQTAKIPMADAEHFIGKYRLRYPRLALWRQGISDFARKNGFVVNPFGRRIYLRVSQDAGVDAPKAIAAVPQSTAADMMLIALRDAADAGLDVLWTVHDELGIGFERPEEVSLMRDIMERPRPELGGFVCPVDMGIGHSWKGAKS